MEKQITLRYKYRLIPSIEQAETLAKFAAYSRGVWNLMLSENERLYRYNKTFLFYNNMSSLLTELKKFDEFSWLKDIDSAAAQQTCKHLDRALKNAFSKKAHQAFPTYKISYRKKKIHQDAYTTVNTNNSIHIKDGCLKIPKIGYVKIKLHRPLKSAIKTITLKYEHGHWYVSIVQTKTVTLKSTLSSSEGYDINSLQTVVGTHGFCVNNPKYLKVNKDKLTQLQRQLARRVKGSNRWQKTKKRINTLHGFIARQRLNFAHQIAFVIAKRSDLVIFEDLNVKGMQRFNGSLVTDNVMGKITGLVSYKTQLRGGLYHEIYRFAKSTGVCIDCHHPHKLDLKQREFTCESCGLHQMRDESAASTIHRIGIDELISAGIVDWVIPTAQQKAPNQTKVFKRLKFGVGIEKKEAA
jgi:putative transposase